MTFSTIGSLGAVAGGSRSIGLLRPFSGTSKNEKVSVHAARDDYGVVIDDDLSVDLEATEVRRRQLRNEPVVTGPRSVTW